METTLATAFEADLDGLTRLAGERLRAGLPETSDGIEAEHLEAAVRTCLTSFVTAWAEGRPFEEAELEHMTSWFDPSDDGPSREVLLHVHRIGVDVVRDRIERRVSELGVHLVSAPAAAMALLRELSLARALERQLTAAVEALATARERARATQRTGLERDLLTALLDMPGDLPTARQLLVDLGLGLTGPWTVAAVPSSRPIERVRKALRAEGLRAALVARPEGVVVLVSGTPDLLVPALADEVAAGIGSQAVVLPEVRRSAGEATAALEVSVGRGVGPVRADRAALDLLLLGAVTPTELVARTLAPLAELDDEPRREWLLETLEAYLDAGTSVTEAGRSLSLHRESVRYRIARVRELFGDELDDPDRRLALHLAVKAHRHGLGTTPAGPS